MIAVALSAVPTAAAQPPPGVTRDDLDSHPLGHGRYSSAVDAGWIYFKAPTDKGAKSIGCGIGPDGSVGCDAVPVPAQIGDSPPVAVPLGANETVADSAAVASYRHSDAPTFTRDVDVLPEGHRLVNGGAACAAMAPTTRS